MPTPDSLHCVRDNTLNQTTVVALRAFGVLLGVLLADMVSGQAHSPARTDSSGTMELAAIESVSAEEHTRFVRRTCVRCHRDRTKTGGLTLESFDLAYPENEPEIAEKMIRKLRAGMMPPPPMKRPDPQAVSQLVQYLESRIDQAAARHPNPVHRTFQRLNRAEYERSVYDLISLPIDAAGMLPPDTISQGFDNIADVQTLSPTLMESYLRAAGKVSRAALGDANGGAEEVTYRVARTASQREHVDGAPWGTRGGLSVLHTFPADGEYSFRATLHSTPTGQLFGATAADQRLEISIDGRRVALLPIDPMMDESDPGGMELRTGAIVVGAGTRRVAAAFLAASEGPVDDLIAPIEHTLADTQIGNAWGMTTVPHLRNLAITGPHNATGLSQTPSRAKIFACRPTTAKEEMICAERIIRQLATHAYRRPLDHEDVGSLLGFYEAGATTGGFEHGIQVALQAILASPQFLFRLERAPDLDPAIEGEVSYRLSDLDLASRLSFFLWGRGPDAELVEVAEAGRLSGEALADQIRRMLADPRSKALATRFASQWLRLQDLDRLAPDALAYPMYDSRLAAAMKQETELFFYNLVREDRSLLDLLDADYTFVNQRLARHYGIEGVSGSHFRRVQLKDPARRGILGQGSMLASTSHANRTSPVLRGKWVMEVLLGSPPPPPPPNVPELGEGTSEKEGRRLTVRERLEAHRASPACASCHRVIDPIGLALENFDVTGAWRSRDEGTPINAVGTLYDGTELAGPDDLRQALKRHSDVFVLTFTEAFLSYATGRRVDYRDMPTVRRIVAGAAEQGLTISSFVREIVDSSAFQRQSVQVASVAKMQATDGTTLDE